jgi:predicted GNAT family acetyltransferase
MLVSLSVHDEVFDKEPFLQDEVRFNLFHRIRGSESPLLVTLENKAAIIGQSDRHAPAWVWTKEDLSSDDKIKLAADFCDLFREATELRLVAKPAIALILAEIFAADRCISYRVSMKMQSYRCPRLIPPKRTSGYIGKPLPGDQDEIVKFLAGFARDCFGTEPSARELREGGERLMRSSDFYVWRDQGAIISTANISHRSLRHARINQVYTRPEKRGQGYARMIISEVVKIILAESRIPMLYTDITNPSSNKAYTDVGFVECGRVDEIIFNF